MKRCSRYLSAIVLFLSLLFTGCGSDIPPGILEIEEMTPIVKDLQLAYAGVDATVQNPKDRPEKYEEMNTLILAKHQMNKETFFESFSFYQEHPALMDSIYKNVITELNDDILELDNKGKNRPGGQPNANQ